MKGDGNMIIDNIYYLQNFHYKSSFSDKIRPLKSQSLI